MSGEYFEKVQVTVTQNITFGDILPDGTKLSYPLKFVQIEVGYPDFNQPVGPDGKANIRFQALGFRRSLGQKQPGALEIARWTKDNARDIITFSFLKLTQPAADFEPDEVIIRKTIAYDPNDPRVDLSGGTSTLVREVRTKDHNPEINAGEVGHIYVKFSPDRPIKSGAIGMTLTCTIGGRKNVLTITKHNYRNIVWEIFSDKFTSATSFTYDLQVEVVGSDFNDVPVKFGTPAPVEVPLPSGSSKVICPFLLRLPPIPPEKVDTINRFLNEG
jgi:hypothetical protein